MECDGSSFFYFLGILEKTYDCFLFVPLELLLNLNFVPLLVDFWSPPCLFVADFGATYRKKREEEKE